MSEHYYTEEIEPILQSSQLVVINWFCQQGLLKTHVFCESCNEEFKTVAYTQNKDEFAFRCMNNVCSCFSRYYTIRLHSFFNKFKIPLKSILKIMFKWCGDISQK
jgi:hypothetical protein